MKFLILGLLYFSLVSTCLAAPREWTIEHEKNFDLILSLLPLYGGFKLNRMINPYSLNSIKNFFQSKPHHYTSFKDELTTEGVFLPDLDQLNWSAIKQEDFDLAKVIVVETTIKQALEPEFRQYIKDYFGANENVAERLKNSLAEMGITYTDDIDSERLEETILNTFSPMVADFLPVAISIAIFG
ncbi:unnamed protein product [Brachionus calyciflorus]|uniref:Uncharacterized protein n=1 Tax=Brachionus calyciflorus TaxID=104777 RepID=A0A814EQV4_9BILA|nr:unnamed protein product [Brachionus calyciflorus]